MTMTRQERLESALLAHDDGGFEAPDPRQNQMGWLRAAIATGYLLEGNLRSYAIVLRSLIGGEEAPDDDAVPLIDAPNSVRRYHTRHRVTEGEDGTRAYVFYTKTPFYIREPQYEEMKRAYANKPHGLGYTINQVCKAFGITRKDFQFVRQEMGWTHDQDEFTREEHLELSTGQLLEDREQRSRWLLEQEEIRKVATEHKDKAAKWDKAIGQYLGLLGNPHAFVEIQHTDPRDKLAIFPMGDFHFEEDDDAERKFQEASCLLQRAAQFEGTEHIVLVFLGDWFQCDTYGGTTTAGTRVGGRNPMESVRLAYTVAYQLLEFAKTLFKTVDTLVLAGNHDRMTTIGFSYWVETVMGKQPWLTENEDSIELKCLEYGNNQLLFEHGDGAKGKLTRIISAATLRFGVRKGIRRTLYTGHLHHTKQQDVDGVNCVQVPAPETLKRNDWEEKGCWSSQHGMRLDIYTKENVYSTLWSGGQF